MRCQIKDLIREVPVVSTIKKLFFYSLIICIKPNLNYFFQAMNRVAMQTIVSLVFLECSVYSIKYDNI